MNISEKIKELIKDQSFSGSKSEKIKELIKEQISLQDNEVLLEQRKNKIKKLKK